jgi:hypothetical protein
MLPKLPKDDDKRYYISCSHLQPIEDEGRKEAYVYRII